MSWYLTIRSDSRYSRDIPAALLVEHLVTLPELVQTGPQDFRNAPDSPWVSLVMAKADGAGHYAVDTLWEPTVNVVELICGDGNEDWYEMLARKIASFLRWEAVNEHERRTIYAAEET